jgi:hypothetical protein
MKNGLGRRLTRSIVNLINIVLSLFFNPINTVSLSRRLGFVSCMRMVSGNVHPHLASTRLRESSSNFMDGESGSTSSRRRLYDDHASHSMTSCFVSEDNETFPNLQGQQEATSEFERM